jgi:hypothetical protein
VQVLEFAYGDESVKTHTSPNFTPRSPLFKVSEDFRILLSIAVLLFEL